MICSACSHENRAGAKFCEECAAPLPRGCPTCGSDVRPAARFCDSCGASLATGPIAKAETRKVVTIVFADIIGSTSLHERLDPESVNRVMERYHGTVRVPV